MTLPGQQFVRSFVCLAMAALLTILAVQAEEVAIQAQQSPNPHNPPMLDSASHLLNTGDYLLVQFFDGRSQDDFKVQVDAEGKITLPVVGSIKVIGMTPTKAAEQITFFYAEYYKNPNATIQVLTYGKLEVFVFGPDHAGKIIQLDNGSRFSSLLKEIEYPVSGQYRQLHILRGGIDFQNLNAPESISTSIIDYGNSTLSTSSPSSIIQGVRPLASYQNWRPWIDRKIRSTETEVWVVDPLALLLEGELSLYNVALQDKDVVFIPTPERFVDIHGVARPGIYELIANENLGDILRMAGTVRYSSDLANAVIQRYDDCGYLERVIVNLIPVLDDFSKTEGIELQNRDVVKIMPHENRIFVLGMVNEAGAFDFIEDGTALDYIALAKGETVDAHMTWIAIIRQSRNRLLVGEAPEIIQVNFKEIHKGFPSCEDMALLPGDVIYVPPKGKSFEVQDVLQGAGTIFTGIAVSNSASNSSSTN